VSAACPFCCILLDEGVKGAGVEDDEVEVAAIAIPVVDAIGQGEAAFHAGESHFPDGAGADEPDDGPLTPVAGD